MKSLCAFLFTIALTSAAPATYDQRQDGSVNVRADLQNFVVIAVIPKMEGGSLLLDNFNRRTQTIDSEQIDDQEPEKIDARVAEPFLEPKTPYHVDISQAKSNLAQLYPIESKSEVIVPQTKSAVSPLLVLSSDESPVPNVVAVKNNRYMTERDARVVEVVNLSDNLSVESDSVDEETVTDVIEPLSEASNDSITRVNRDSGLTLLGAMEQCGPDLYRDHEGVCRLIEDVEQ
ncbi:uncharacterized protein LOC143918341 isoform X2 [Arctopsyche grandis]|uniref:uncharacterized protein LOC143918341 isoform X2 n=1 Tax=Arctopsyche grandis TaxID=121162 RepID=UPI00406D7976